MILQIYLSCSNFLFDQVLDKCHSEKFNMVFITLPCFGTYTQFAIWPAQSKVGHILFVLSRKLMMPFSIRLKVIMEYLWKKTGQLWSLLYPRFLYHLNLDLHMLPLLRNLKKRFVLRNLFVFKKSFILDIYIYCLW